uniref:Uncharacterized protein n=1 Tax=Meloidogyne enterolobii TaxID=390850 RepID=A0A6V7W3S8_MELEN|nr:unnamed protein product [Meloidogyne enterolobii]
MFKNALLLNILLLFVFITYVFGKKLCLDQEHPRRCNVADQCCDQNCCDSSQTCCKSTCCNKATEECCYDKCCLKGHCCKNQYEGKCYDPSKDSCCNTNSGPRTYPKNQRPLPSFCTL